MAAETQPPPSSVNPRRRFWAPEVVQTSAMDCGPAAIKCLLEGFGIPVSYGRLREACQTSVDGTSIDTLEEVARLLGLDAEQIMLPTEHVVAPEAGVLPAIAVTQLRSETHFVVLWRRVGSYLQVMDPARGRRWVRAADFMRDLYLHTQPVAAEAFAAFATDGGFTGPLEWRVRRLMGTARAHALLGAMGGQEGTASGVPWRAIARLDAATRAAQLLVDAGTLQRGHEAEKLVQALISAPDDGPGGLLALHACAYPTAAPPADEAVAPPADDKPAEEVVLRGAVLIRVSGRLAPAGREGGDASAALPIDLAAALDEKREPLWRTLVGLWTPRAKRWALPLLAAALVAGVATIAEVVLARPLLEGTGVDGFVLLCVVVLGLLLLELPLAFGARNLGRALDRGLRRAFLHKLPRLGDRYFSSRPVSDMAERAHLLHRVRLLPGLAAQLARAVFELVLMTVAIAWLYPGGAPVAFALLAIACLVPLLAVPALAERDLRLRTHSGSLMRFYLDALLGLSAIRTHGAERAVKRAHEERLNEWRRAGGDMVRASLWVESAVVSIAAVGAAVLVVGSFSDAATAGGRAGTALLLLFFALSLPTHAARLVGLWRQIPDHRNVTLRLVEPLGAPEEQPVGDDGGGTPAGPSARSGVMLGADSGSQSESEVPAVNSPVAIALDQVSVEAGGHRVLDDVSVTIAPFSHVAIVGASGAGKSTLLGLLLGFYRPIAGVISVDGKDLHRDARALAVLRAQTVWVEPAVRLWNTSLTDNVAYGARPRPSADQLARAIADAELTEVASRLGDDGALPLGEGGGLLSGGEGQRVRLARELVRVEHPRLVLLDEPFRGLDRQTRHRLLARARRRWAGATLIAVTHDVEHTKDFPRVLVVEGGRVVEDGEPGRLALSAGSRYAELLAAEKRVHDSRWSAALWRRLVVRDGRLHVPE